MQLLTRAAVAESPAASGGSGEKIKIGINGFGRIGRLVARLVRLNHRSTVDRIYRLNQFPIDVDHLLVG